MYSEIPMRIIENHTSAGECGWIIQGGRAAEVDVAEEGDTPNETAAGADDCGGNKTHGENGHTQR